MADWRHGLGQVVRRLAASPARAPLAAAHAAAVSTQVALARARASAKRVGPYRGGDVTLAIKTFERPETLRRMLDSVRDVFDGPILIADDSHTSFVSDDPDVRVIALPFDSGVGAGRTRLLEEVGTEFVWMCDDDFILLPDFDLGRAVSFLNRHREVDLYAGAVIKLPQWQSFNYASTSLLVRTAAPKIAVGTLIEGIPVLSKVPNFYVGRTVAVRQVGYDPRLKRLDHNDFFSSAMGRLVSCYDRRWRCFHAQTLFDLHYQSFRNDIAEDVAYLQRKWSGGGLAQGQEASPEALATFHRAALRRVAADLDLEAHVLDPDTVGCADPGKLRAALLDLGWTRSGDALTHPLWGRIRVGELNDVGASPDASTAPARPVSVAADQLTWSTRVAWAEANPGILVAGLPVGPVLRLDPPADALWRTLGPDPTTAETAIAEVLADFADAPPEAGAQLSGLLDDLQTQGVVVRGPQSGESRADPA